MSKQNNRAQTIKSPSIFSWDKLISKIHNEKVDIKLEL